MLKIGTDCSGIEAPIQAIEKICDKYSLSYSHEFSSEINQYAIKLIQGNYSPKIIFDDITKRDTKELPDIDIYVSGFPCQPFSRANKFKTPVDPRLNLFKNCLDVIFHCKPKVFILENVKTLVTLNNGSYFKEIIEQLENKEMYVVNWKVLNTKDYGIPQNRERVIIFCDIASPCSKLKLRTSEKSKNSIILSPNSLDREAFPFLPTQIN